MNQAKIKSKDRIKFIYNSRFRIENKRVQIQNIGTNSSKVNYYNKKYLR